MSWLVKKTVSLMLSIAFALSTMAVASAASCPARSVVVADSASAMACCVEHTTAGMNAPCQCSVKSTPATPAQETLGATAPDLVPDFVETLEPKVFVAFQREPINSQWLAYDIRLRAPPQPLYLLKCSFLE